MSRTKRYPSDLSDDEWTLLQPFLDPPWSHGGRPPCVPRRQIVNAIFYQLRTGGQWRYLPAEFPHWNTVYGYFAKWRDDGTWERINDTLRRHLRTRLGRHPDPSAAIVDSQSAKTTEKGGSVVSMPGSW